MPPSAQEVVGGERQSADPGHRWRGYAGRQLRLRGLAELIAETTTHHLESDPQLNAWRWSTTEHDRPVAVAHPHKNQPSSSETKSYPDTAVLAERHSV